MSANSQIQEIRESGWTLRVCSFPGLPGCLQSTGREGPRRADVWGKEKLLRRWISLELAVMFLASFRTGIAGTRWGVFKGSCVPGGASGGIALAWECL